MTNKQNKQIRAATGSPVCGAGKPRMPHWYKRFISECPVCGAGDEVRERQFTPRPDDPSERIEYDGMAYDWCMEYAALSGAL